MLKAINILVIGSANMDLVLSVDRLARRAKRSAAEIWRYSPVVRVPTKPAPPPNWVGVSP